MLKTSNRIKTIALILCIFIVPFFSLIYSENSREITTKIEEEKTPKRSGFWTVNGNTIIDESNPTLNWANTTINYGWCSGSGTWNDPYIIENVTFDAQITDSALEIINSNVFFIIRNSTFRISGGDEWPGYDAGLKLTNTNNGFISNNTMEYNNAYHLYMKYCDNNTITENNFYWSGDAGLLIANSNGN